MPLGHRTKRRDRDEDDTKRPSLKDAATGAPKMKSQGKSTRSGSVPHGYNSLDTGLRVFDQKFGKAAPDRAAEARRAVIGGTGSRRGGGWGLPPFLRVGLKSSRPSDMLGVRVRKTFQMAGGGGPLDGRLAFATGFELKLGRRTSAPLGADIEPYAQAMLQVPIVRSKHVSAFQVNVSPTRASLIAKFDTSPPKSKQGGTAAASDPRDAWHTAARLLGLRGYLSPGLRFQTAPSTSSPADGGRATKGGARPYLGWEVAPTAAPALAVGGTARLARGHALVFSPRIPLPEFGLSPTMPGLLGVDVGVRVQAGHAAGGGDGKPGVKGLLPLEATITGARLSVRLPTTKVAWG